MIPLAYLLLQIEHSKTLSGIRHLWQPSSMAVTFALTQELAALPIATKLKTGKARGLTETGGARLLLLVERLNAAELELVLACLELFLRSASSCALSCAFS